MVASRRDYVLNSVINQYKYEHYLEIGIGQARKNFNKIRCKYKTGVDPRVKCDYQMTSDKFFKLIPSNKIYDLIYIDGDHSCSQVLKDVHNSLKHLDVNGLLVLHDVNPQYKEDQGKIGKGKFNTAWKAFAILRMTRTDLYMCVVDIKHGAGIIKRGNQKLFPLVPNKKLTYEFLEKNKAELLNLCSMKKFDELKNNSNLFNNQIKFSEDEKSIE